MRFAKDNIARSGLNLLKRLVFEESSLEPDNRRGEERQPVVGEVVVVVLSKTGEPLGKTKVFVRDLSKSGCGLWSRTRFDEGAIVVLQFAATAEKPPSNRKAIIAHCRGHEGSGFAVGCRFISEGTGET
ncbi:MAG: PilZ domain-containing protein [Phycisphaerales bacterium]|nr:PilZ domain-containing protein [Phycisphaerales bacterium]